jgi:hypothetical protein
MAENAVVAVEVKVKASGELAAVNATAAQITKKLESVVPNVATTVKDLKTFSASVDRVAKKLGEGAARASKEAAAAAADLEDLQGKLASAAEAYKAAPGDDRAKKVFEDLESAVAEANKLAKKAFILDLKTFKLMKKETAKSEARRSAVREATGFGLGAAGLAGAGGLASIMGGDASGLKTIGGTIGKSIGAYFSKQQQTALEYAESTGDAAKIAKAEGNVELLGTGLKAIGGAAAGFGALAALVAAASDKIVELNKVLLDGVGLASDLGTTGEEYSKMVDRIVLASNEFGRANMEVGASTKDYSAVVNTLSSKVFNGIRRTEDELNRIDGGGEKFAASMLLYGKALNMSLTDITEKTGEISRQFAMGIPAATNAMRSLIEISKESNISMPKIVNIFDVASSEMGFFNVRMEELLGTISSLTKAMSESTVKRFISAFKGGFQTSGPQERLKAAIIAGGVPKMARDEMVARLEDTLRGMGKGPEEIARAVEMMQKGQRGEFYGTLTAGKGLPPETAEALTKAFETFQMARGKDPMAAITAMKSFSPNQMFEVLTRMKSKFTDQRLIQQLDEFVTSALGFTEEQKVASNDIAMSATRYLAELKSGSDIGDTKVMEYLRNLAAKRLAPGTTLDAKKIGDAVNADDIISAILSSKNFMENVQTPIDQQLRDLARKQYQKTTSITDILKNSIAFLLEKLALLLQGPIAKLGEWLMKTLGGGDVQTAIDIDKKYAKLVDTASQGPMESWDGKTRTPQEIQLIGKTISEAVQQSPEVAGRKLAEVFGADLGYLNMAPDGTRDALFDAIRTSGPIFTGANDAEEYAEKTYELMASGKWAEALGRMDKTEFLGKASELFAQLRLTPGAKSRASGEILAGQLSRTGETADQIATNAASTALGEVAPSATIKPMAKTATSSAETATATTRIATVVRPQGLDVVANGMSTSWQNDMAKAVEKGVEPPLVKTAMTLIRAQSDAGYAAALAVADVDLVRGFSQLANRTEDLGLTPFADGGSVGATGRALVHRGEEVITAENVSLLKELFGRGPRGGGSVTVNVAVQNAGATAQEIGAAVRATLQDIYRREATA